MIQFEHKLAARAFRKYVCVGHTDHAQKNEDRPPSSDNGEKGASEVQHSEVKELKA